MKPLTLAVLLLPLAGCAWKSDFEELKKAHETLQAEHQQLQAAYQVQAQKIARIEEKTNKIKFVGDDNALLILPSEGRSRVSVKE
jgi:Tfp pilus assembly protein PilO